MFGAAPFASTPYASALWLTPPPVPVVPGNIVCADASLGPRIAARANVGPRVSATAGTGPRVAARATTEEC
jgi:hypothetical protein